MPPRKVRKFKIGDVVRVKGDRKLARVLRPPSSGASPNLLTLDRKIHGKTLWHYTDLILVRASPRRKEKSLNIRRAQAKISKNRSSRVLK